MKQGLTGSLQVVGRVCTVLGIQGFPSCRVLFPPLARSLSKDKPASITGRSLGLRDTAGMRREAGVEHGLTGSLQVVGGIGPLLSIQGFPGCCVFFLALQLARLLEVLDGGVHQEVDVVHQQAAEVPVAALATLLCRHPLPGGSLRRDCPQIRCNYRTCGQPSDPDLSSKAHRVCRLKHRPHRQVPDDKVYASQQSAIVLAGDSVIFQFAEEHQIPWG